MATRSSPTELTTAPSDLRDHPAPTWRSQGGRGGSLRWGLRRVFSYTDLDTLVGSSGAGVLTMSGYLLGIHSDGDCATDGSGANRGSTAAGIVETSSYLMDSDIADR
jgi:hypothetical protein